MQEQKGGNPLSTMLLVPLEDVVVFPNMNVNLAVDVGDEDRVLLVPRHENAYAKVGTVADVAERVRLPGGGTAVALAGLHRGVAGAAHTDASGRLRVVVDERPDVDPPGIQIRDLEREYRAVVEEILELRGDDGRIVSFVRSITEPGALADTCGYSPDLSFEQKVQLLEALDVVDRLELAVEFQRERLAELQVRKRIREDVESGAAKQQREYVLRKQLESIRRELGEPGAKRSDDQLDPTHAREVLDADHAGLEDVKDRVIEYLAVRKLRAERGVPDDKRSGAILTLVGPPGTGKTSIGESIARAMGREFVRMSLGGIRDEAEIRGHRRTYIGALPGRIIQGLRRSGTRDPLFMLDEIDKVGADWQGDPTSALLEVLDPAQNSTFVDTYLSVAFDLSQVLFIATANTLDTIPEPLRDRMETLQIAGYTEDEKLRIATRYLVPQQRAANGLHDE